MPNATIITGDNRIVLPRFPDNHFHCSITSPPYWLLRDYALPPSVWGSNDGCEHEWGAPGTIHTGGLQKDDYGGQRVGRDFSAQNAVRDCTTGQFCLCCGAWLGSLGLEPTPELYVEHIVEAFREVRRVLRDDGQCFINIGDTRSKDRQWVGIPWRLAFALQADGWRWEDEIIWEKPNCMPGSQRNRCTRSHEIILQMNKTRKAFFDQDAIREPHQDKAGVDRFKGKGGISDNGYEERKWIDRSDGLARPPMTMKNRDYNPAGRNKRTVWTIPTHPFPQAHFATFPPKLVEPMIKAATSQRGACPECGKAWARVVEKENVPTRGNSTVGPGYRELTAMGQSNWGDSDYSPGIQEVVTIGWQPACSCHEKDEKPSRFPVSLTAGFSITNTPSPSPASSSTPSLVGAP